MPVHGDIGDSKFGLSKGCVTSIIHKRGRVTKEERREMMAKAVEHAMDHIKGNFSTKLPVTKKVMVDLVATKIMPICPLTAKSASWLAKEKFCISEVVLKKSCKRFSRIRLAAFPDKLSDSDMEVANGCSKAKSPTNRPKLKIAARTA